MLPALGLWQLSRKVGMSGPTCCVDSGGSGFIDPSVLGGPALYQCDGLAAQVLSHQGQF